jgi:hypothetical protein
VSLIGFQRPLEGGYLDRFQGSKPGFDQKLNFTQIAKPRYDATVAGRVQPRYQQTAGLYERAARRRLGSGVQFAIQQAYHSSSSLQRLGPTVLVAQSNAVLCFAP